MATIDYKKELGDLIDMVMAENGSDLHFSVGSHPIARVTGALVPIEKKPVLTAEDTEGFIAALLTREQLAHFKATREIDFSYEGLSGGRFRGNGFYQRGTIAVALRYIPDSIRTLEELNLPPVLEMFAAKRQGFFLCVGPVGQGKTTTLAALIDRVNATRTEHIITIEDPVEYVFEPKQSLIEQREVRVDTANFETALTSVFRQDVDVIMLGEMRNREAMSAAVTAAETGHLVFSTLHTNDAAQTIDRIIDTFPATQQDQVRIQLASSLAGIFSQRLIPRIAGGLVPAYELLISNNAVANLVRERRTHEIQTVIETGAERGMIDMNRCLVGLVQSGEITVENAFTYSLNPKGLERLL